mgnify:FL=1
MNLRWTAPLLLTAATACTMPAAMPGAGAGIALPADATAHPESWPEAHSPAAITDPATESAIDALIARMSLEQKVGQLVQADISAIEPEDLATYPLGSILAGGNSGPYGNERASAADWDKLVRAFRDVSERPAANGVAIPIIFGVDAVHGHNNIPGATVFPHNIGLGAAHDPAMIRRIGAATAAEIAGSGIEWTFAPTLAVPQDPRWGRTYEGYSSDPALVAVYAGAMVEGLQGNLVSGRPLGPKHVAATAKHFLADGGTQGGKDQGDAVIPESELISVHAQGYPAAIDAGALTVMASFSSWNGVKNHGNPSLLIGVLKDRMGFEGFVVGDWNGHAQVEGCTNTDCPRAIEAGLDMFMAPDSWKDLYANTVKRAQSGDIPMARIDDAVRRILRVKYKLGLMDQNPPVRRDYAAVGAPEHLALAREAVAKSLVLLKNEGSVLPIKPGAKVLVTGPGADDMAMQSGGWTVSWQGTDVTRADFPNGQTIWEGIKQAVEEVGGTAILSPDGSYDGPADVAIAVYGETPYAEFQGDVPTLDYQPAGARDLALLKRLKAKGMKTVSLFLSGRPMFANPEINASDAFVAAWLPGTQGAGIADVIVARRDGATPQNFTGRLPFAWPASAASPVTDPLFARGYGLDYSAGGSVGTLSEDPGIDMAQALNIGRFFAAGRVQAPWSLSIGDAGGKRFVEGSAARSPEARVTASAVDVRAQEDGRRFVWTGPGQVAIEGPPADLSARFDAGQALEITGVLQAAGVGDTQLFLGDRAVPLGPLLAAARTGEVTSWQIPLRCFAGSADDLRAVGNAMRIEGKAALDLTLLDVRLVDVGAASCPSAAN